MNDDQCPGAGVLASIESCSAACNILAGNKGIQNKQQRWRNMGGKMAKQAEKLEKLLGAASSHTAK